MPLLSLEEPICEQRPRTVLFFVVATTLLFIAQVIWAVVAMPRSEPKSAMDPSVLKPRSAATVQTR